MHKKTEWLIHLELPIFDVSNYMKIKVQEMPTVGKSSLPVAELTRWV